MTFGEAVAEWQPFYAALCGASATFAGLLFVSLSLNLKLLDAVVFPREARLARHTFTSFLSLVVISLVFLIPHSAPLGLAIPLLIVGAMAIAQSLRTLRADRGESKHGFRRHYWLSAVTYAMLMLVAAALADRQVQSLYILVSLVIWQLAWTTRVSWELLSPLHPRGPSDDARR